MAAITQLSRPARLKRPLMRNTTAAAPISTAAYWP